MRKLTKTSTTGNRMTELASVTGERLRAMRREAGHRSVKTAVEAINEAALFYGSGEQITERQLYAWESLHTDKQHKRGASPPTFRQLALVIRAFRGSPAYLFYGTGAATYPLSDGASRLQAIIQTDNMIELINLLVDLPSDRRQLVLQTARALANKPIQPTPEARR